MKDFKWLNENSRLFLKRGYIDNDPIERLREISDNAETILKLKGFSNKFFDYLSKGYYSLSSPIWSNFGNDKGLPISCYGSYIGDSIHQIMWSTAEVGTMSKHGGGTSGYFGHIRPRGSKITNNGESNGSFEFLKLFDTTIDVVSQGSTRKGQFAAYIDIDHPDIEEWLNIHTEGNPIQLMYYGVCISRKWFRNMKDGNIKKRKIWTKLLERRSETGIPYIFFTDNANTIDIYKDTPIRASNLCSEITLPTNDMESFVCCLSSMNLLYYDEWKNNDAVKTLIYFLDAVMSEFIEKSRSNIFLSLANNFAKDHRALGLGVLGYHSYLQSKNIPFEEGMHFNNQIFKYIQKETIEASEELGELYGRPHTLELKDYKRRNTTLTAIAPTKSSSFILEQVSPSIEPLRSNYYIKDLANNKIIYKNPFLIKLLKSKNKDTLSVWNEIANNNGSVQKLTFLTAREKDIFKTFEEINQLNIIQQAAQRQQYIDQSQSLNLMIHPKTELKDINDLYVQGEMLGVKSFYYQYSINFAQEFNRELTNCSSCES